MLNAEREGWLPAAWVVEAEILERNGLGAEAAHRFHRALELWGKADPEMEPWVTRAREGLERSGG